MYIKITIQQKNLNTCNGVLIVMIKMEKLRLKVGRVSFSRSSGRTYITLVDDKGKAIGKITLSKEYPIYDIKEVAFFDDE